MVVTYENTLLFELVDIIITQDADKMQTVIKKLGNLNIKVATKKELIEMKRVSDRPQDRQDIKALEKLL